MMEKLLTDLLDGLGFGCHGLFSRDLVAKLNVATQNKYGFKVFDWASGTACVKGGGVTIIYELGDQDWIKSVSVVC